MDANKYIPVDWNISTLNSSQNKKFDCNTLVFTNQGTQNVTIDANLILTPGMSYTFECYPGEMQAHSFDIVFTNDLAAGAVLVVVEKVYKPKA